MNPFLNALKDNYRAVKVVLLTPVSVYADRVNDAFAKIPWPQPVIETIHHFIKPVDGDEYGRSQFAIDLDKTGGVDKHQLDVRYGLIKHEVVKPGEREPDWVDVLEARLHNRFRSLIEMNPTVR